MQKKLILIVAIVLGVTTSAFNAQALPPNQAMIARYRVQLDEAVKAYVQTWIQGKPKVAYREPLRRIADAESMLLSYGEDPTSEVLVGHLMPEDQNLQLFAARLYFREIEKETGWTADLPGILKGKTYRVKVTDAAGLASKDKFRLTVSLD